MKTFWERRKTRNGNLRSGFRPRMIAILCFSRHFISLWSAFQPTQYNWSFMWVFTIVKFHGMQHFQFVPILTVIEFSPTTIFNFQFIWKRTIFMKISSRISSIYH
jgi:hypothetical protein